MPVPEAVLAIRGQCRWSDEHRHRDHPPDILEVVLRYLRRHKSLPPMTDNLLVVNRQNEFIGTLAISKLLVSDPQQTVREVMSTDARVIQATQHESEAVAVRAPRSGLGSGG